MTATIERPTTSTARARRVRRARSRWGWLEVVVPILVIAVIWIVSLGSKAFFFPPLPQILQAFADSWLFDRVPTDLLPSLARLGIGFFSGLIIGALLGFVLGSSRTLFRMYSPVIEFLRSLPAPAILPVLILLLGIGPVTQVTLIAFGTVWPVLLSTMDGVRGADTTMLDTADSLRVSRWNRFVHVTVPAASPQVFAGAKTALSIAIILMVISEMVGSANGVGYFVIQAQRQFDMPSMWAGIILLGIVGYVLNLLFDVLERRALAWHHGARGRAE